MGIIEHEAIDYLVNLCKGRDNSLSSDWFYSLFLNRTNTGIASTANGVREQLRRAWWVEEEDLRQEIYIAFHELRMKDATNLLRDICIWLRDYLIVDQKAFLRQLPWKDAYRYEFYNESTKEEFGLKIVFTGGIHTDDKLPVFERYLAYLAYVLRIPSSKLCDVLLFDAEYTRRLTCKLRTKLEELCQTQKPKQTLSTRPSPQRALEKPSLTSCESPQ